MAQPGGWMNENDSIPPIHALTEGIHHVELLYSDWFPRSQNTINSTSGYSRRHWLRENFPRGWLYTSQAMNQPMYHQPAHASIKIPPVPAELAK